jgi:hypothetical protein
MMRERPPAPSSVLIASGGIAPWTSLWPPTWRRQRPVRLGGPSGGQPAVPLHVEQATKRAAEGPYFSAELGTPDNFVRRMRA